MLCDECHKNLATIHLIKVVNEESMRLNLCESCAQKLAAESALNFFFTFPKLLASIFDAESPEGLVQVLKEGLREEEDLLTCGICGISFAEVKENGRLGCEDCYQTFSPKLTSIFKKVQEGFEHTGKIPKQLGEEARLKFKIRALGNRLKDCVEKENYEEAAKLRDEIRRLESLLAQVSRESKVR